ncbi:MAG: glycosyltransferase family 2 protein [Candidatus Omnitrophota bacterium]
MYNNSEIAVIIPAFNEERSISKVLEEIPKDIADEVIVVDNGSTDRTAEEAAKSGAKVIRENERGYGVACLKGLSSVKDADIIVILDADHSDYPEQMARLVQPIVDGEADFVIGSRTLGKREKGALAPQAYWGNKLAVFLISLFFGFDFTDMGPFRAVKYDSLRQLNMADRNFGWNAEMQVKAVRCGLKIKEIPVDYRRRVGSSKISGTISGTVLAGTKIIYTIIKYFFVKT